MLKVWHLAIVLAVLAVLLVVLPAVLAAAGHLAAAQP